jgi:ubiquinone/menaquinone biosynthesis C-methylase UbiE
VALHPAAHGFETVADDYERGRPDYPLAALERLIKVSGIGPDAVVLDLAAGTGKLTRSLAATGAHVIAVEPTDGMRAVLAATLPAVDVRDGTAEDIPVADGTVSAVTVGQAFHWFAGRAALAEIHRVLRPHGTLAVLYNHRDRREPWVAATDAVFQPLRGSAPDQRDGAWRAAFAETILFSPLEEATFSNPQRLTPAEMVARVRSVSFVGGLSPAQQSGVLAEVADVLATHPDTAGRDELVLPHTTTLSWCRRR